MKPNTTRDYVPLLNAFSAGILITKGVDELISGESIWILVMSAGVIQVLAVVIGRRNYD